MPRAKPDDAGWLIGRNYQLFRYMLACNRGGELPLLFNGGIFTTDNMPGRITGNNNDELPIFQGGPITPDFRRWMGCHFMSQNQRWLGWPNLANGDADLLAPSLAFYRDRADHGRRPAKINGAEGVVYPEPLDIWGLCCVAPRPDGLCGAEHLTYHFSMMLEHAWMAIQAHDALGISMRRICHGSRARCGSMTASTAPSAKKRTGKELGDDGKLVIYPRSGLEYAGGATNPDRSRLRPETHHRRTAGPAGTAARRARRLQQIQSTSARIAHRPAPGSLSLLPAKSSRTRVQQVGAHRDVRLPGRTAWSASRSRTPCSWPATRGRPSPPTAPACASRITPGWPTS